MIGSTPTGKVLVNAWNGFYYLWSPPTAAAIAGSEVLRGVFRVLLLPLVAIIHATAWVFTSLGAGDFASIVAFSVAALLSVLAYVIAPAFLLRPIASRARRWGRRMQ